MFLLKSVNTIEEIQSVETNFQTTEQIKFIIIVVIIVIINIKWHTLIMLSSLPMETMSKTPFTPRRGGGPCENNLCRIKMV